LSVGHRFAPKDRIVELLERERLRYDITLPADKAALVEQLQRQGRSICFVGDGINDAPALARADVSVSLTGATRVATDTAQVVLLDGTLRQLPGLFHLAAGMERNFQRGLAIATVGPWQGIVTELHARAQWVACVDAFVDKWLVGGAGPDRPEGRKIVGFESGLGAYGELNLTISTQHDGLDLLERRLTGELTGLLPQQAPAELKGMAKRIVADAEAIIGLASLRAVLGQGEQLREVIGFSAIARLWQAPAGQMSQLLPLDALRHWLADEARQQRADLRAAAVH